MTKNLLSGGPCHQSENNNKNMRISSITNPNQNLGDSCGKNNKNTRISSITIPNQDLRDSWGKNKNTRNSSIPIPNQDLRDSWGKNKKQQKHKNFLNYHPKSGFEGFMGQTLHVSGTEEVPAPES